MLRRALTAISALCLTACLVQPVPETATPTLAVTLTPAVSSPTPTAPIPSPAPITLRVWLPAEFAPDVNTPTGRVLAEQLAQFEAAQTDVVVDVRLKASEGPNGLLAVLQATANAAPGVLPNVIALPTDDLWVAAQAGLVLPLNEVLPEETLTDTYPVAQALGQVNGQWLGAPFALDASVLAYNTEVYPDPPLTWADLVTGTFIFPGADPAALPVLNVYLALGGTLSGPNGELTLDAEILAQALALWQSLQTNGQVPLSTLNHADTATTWQVFRERRATLALTSVHWYLEEHTRLSAARATVLPTLKNGRLALAEGWSWALVNTAPEHQAQSAALINWLLTPENAGKWTYSVHMLPTRPAALAFWPTTGLTPFASDVLTHAQPRPRAEVLARLGPLLNTALAEVLNGQATPLAAATAAVAALK